MKFSTVKNHTTWECKLIYAPNFHVFLNKTGAFGTEYLHMMPFSNSGFREYRYNNESRTSLKDANEICPSF